MPLAVVSVLPTPPSSTSSSSTTVAVGVEFSYDPVDELPEHRGEWSGYLAEALNETSVEECLVLTSTLARSAVDSFVTPWVETM